MSEFAVALAWGMAVLGAFFGWGWAAKRLGRHRATTSHFTEGFEYLEMPAWGMAMSVVIGGVLNLCFIANRGVVCVYVVVGLVLAVIPAAGLWKYRKRFWRGLRADPPGLLVLIAVVSLLAVRFAASTIVPSFAAGAAWHGAQFNPHDDMHSYLVSVERMLQTGSAGLDPYNSRQMANALGGEHFLNALTIAPLAVDNIHMLEGGIGLAVLCLASAGLGLRIARGVEGWEDWKPRAADLMSSGRVAAAMMLVPLVVGWAEVNLSSLVTAAAALMLLVSALYQVMEARRVDSPAARYLWLGGLALGAVCSLKSTMIPAACLMVALVSVGKAVFGGRLRAIIDGLIIGGIAVGVMLPWMIWQYCSSRTLLFPILGKGDHVESYFRVDSPSLPSNVKFAAAVGVFLPVILLLVLGIAWCFRDVRRVVGKTLAIIVAAFLAAWIVDWIVLSQTTDMPDVERYITSVKGVGLAPVLITLWRVGHFLATRFGKAHGRYWGRIAVCGVILLNYPGWKSFYFSQFPESLGASLDGKLGNWEGGADRVRKMQEAVSPGETMLVYLGTPAMLDFRRNRIYVADWPGESSPSPGMPVRAGAEAVADYLLGQKIRYVAYSYRTEANFPARVFKIYDSANFGRIISRQAAESFLFQDELAELARSRRVIFDDGTNFVLDLAEVRTQPAATRQGGG